MTTKREQQAEIRRLSAERRRLKGKGDLSGGGQTEARRSAGSALRRASDGQVPPTAPAPSAEPAKRLSLSQIVELLLTRPTHDRSSVTAARNARGIPQFEVVVATGSPGIDTLQDAERVACEVYDRLEARWPYYEAPNGKT